MTLASDAEDTLADEVKRKPRNNQSLSPSRLDWAGDNLWGGASLWHPVSFLMAG
jgi:hypothetical protein